VSLPPQGPGLCHIALLPGAKPDTTSSNNTAQEDSKDSAAPAASPPLLLLPLLVLPEEAAAEMQHGWQAAALAAGKGAAAAAASDNARSADVSAAIAEVWAGVVSSLTVDIAYVLSACSAASAVADTAKAATASSNSTTTAEHVKQLPAGVSAVLTSVLQHLAARGMFQTMKFLVDTATAAVTGTAAANNSSDAASSCVASSSRNCSSCSEVEPLVEQPIAANAAAAAAERPVLLKPVKHQMDDLDVHHSDGHTPCTPRTLTAAAEPVYPASSTKPSLLQLLCGFADPLLESRFMAATFRSSTTLDLFSALYNFTMGIGCWFAAGGKLSSLTSPHNEQQQQHEGSVSFGKYQAAAAGAWLEGWSIRLVWSVVVVALLHVGPSLGVAVLRVRTYLKLRRVRKQQDDVTVGNAEQAAAGAAAAVYGEAGFARQRLLAGLVASISLLNVLCATGGVIAPIMIVRAWGLHSWAQDAAMTLVLVVKAWMYQVRETCACLGVCEADHEACIAITETGLLHSAFMVRVLEQFFTLQQLHKYQINIAMHVSSAVYCAAVSVSCTFLPSSH
jgi:hypothetical protein